MQLLLAIPVFVASVCFAGAVHADQLAAIKLKGEIVIGVRVAAPIYSDQSLTVAPASSPRRT